MTKFSSNTYFRFLLLSVLLLGAACNLKLGLDRSTKETAFQQFTHKLKKLPVGYTYDIVKEDDAGFIIALVRTPFTIQLHSPS